MRTLPRRALVRLSVAAAACGAASAHAAVPIEACNAEGFESVIQAAPASFDARAVWLDRRLVQWPGADGAGSFRLYHSPTSGIQARAGAKVSGAAGSLALAAFKGQVPAAAAGRFKWVGKGPVLALADGDLAQLPALHRGQLVLVQEAPDGTVLKATRIQLAGALDDLYARAADVNDLGATVGKKRTAFKLWAPTARQVAVCTYDTGNGRATGIGQMKLDAPTGVWSFAAPADMSGKYYKYAVDVVVDGVGVVRNMVTDPYSVSLTTNSTRSYIADLGAASLKPKGWDAHKAPDAVKSQVDMTIYELHVRDFSINDGTVSAANRGKYGAFGEIGSNGMKHLKALAKAGMTDIHLLPVYDIGSVPEKNCAQPKPVGGPASDTQQALISKTAETDCFNWGYDPFHYSAP
ncbi:MAG: DUF3372 domain-containing protein, partial [Telluria sp.]